MNVELKTAEFEHDAVPLVDRVVVDVLVPAAGPMCKGVR